MPRRRRACSRWWPTPVGRWPATTSSGSSSAERARRDPDGRDRAAAAYPLPEAAFDTQIAAYILNAALRSQSLADIANERLGVELPKPGALNGPQHAAVEAAAVRRHAGRPGAAARRGGPGARCTASSSCR